MDRPTDLLGARERAGLSLDQAAEKTRIPKKYLEALEKGDLGAFPPGPFLGGYTRQYRKFLGLPETPVAAPLVAPLPAPQPVGSLRSARGPGIGPGGAEELDERTVTMPNVLRQSRGRLLALAVAVCSVVALTLQVAQVASREAPTDIGQAPDQVVNLRVNEPVRAEVIGDGHVLFAGTLAPGEAREFKAHDRLELDLGSLVPVTVQYNGETLKPLGAQSRPRRLVFIDDLGE